MVRVYWKALIWNLLILVATLIPSDGIPDTGLELFPHADKVIHFIMYAVLTLLILQKNQEFFPKYPRIRVLSLSFLYVFLMGLFLEILQNSFLIGRNFDIFDVVANTLGALMVVFYFEIIHYLKRK